MAAKTGEERLKEMEAEMALFEQEVLGASVPNPPAAPVATSVGTPVALSAATPVTEPVAPQAAAPVAPLVATPMSPQAEDAVAPPVAVPSEAPAVTPGDDTAVEPTDTTDDELVAEDAPTPAAPANRPIISTNTYQQVQQTLEARAAAQATIVAPPMPFVGPAVPPTRPASLRPSFVPHVLQRTAEPQPQVLRPSFVPHVLQRPAGPRHPVMRHPLPLPPQHPLQHQHPLPPPPPPPPPPHQHPQHPHQQLHPHQNPFSPQHPLQHQLQHQMQNQMQHQMQNQMQNQMQHQMQNQMQNQMQQQMQNRMQHQMQNQMQNQMQHQLQQQMQQQIQQQMQQQMHHQMQLPHQHPLQHPNQLPHQHPHQLPHPQSLMSHAMPGPPQMLMNHPIPRPPGSQMGSLGPMRPSPPAVPGATIGPMAPMVPSSRAVIQAAPKMNQTVIQAAPTVYSAPVVKKQEEEIPEPQPVAEEKEVSVMEDMVIGPIMPVEEPVQPELVVEPVAEDKKKSKQEKLKRCIRTAAGTNWEDQSLLEWDTDDFRIFCGDLGNEVNDDILARAFSRYPSFLKAKVIRDKRTGKTKGYGFVSFKDPNDYVRAMREMNGKYVGSRPIKLRKSSWKDRNIDVVRKKQKEKKKLGLR